MTSKQMFKCGVFFAMLFVCLKMPSVIFAACNDDGAGNIVCDNTASFTYNQTDPLTGDTFTKTGSGAVAIQGGLTVNNNLDISEGILIIDAANTPQGNFGLGLTGVLQTSGDISLSNNTTTNNGILNVYGEDSALTLSGSLTGASLNKSGAGVLFLNTTNTYSGALNIAQGDVVTNTAAFQGNAVLAQDTSVTFEQTTDGVFAGSVTGGTLFKEGAGSISLTGANTADAFVSQGALEISSATALQGGLTLEGGSLNVHGNVTLGAAAQDILLTSSTQSEGFNIDAGTTLTFGQNINLSGGGNLVKNGEGSLVLGGDASSFTGGVVVNKGILSVGDAAYLGIGLADVVLGGGELAFTDTSTLAKNINIAAAGSTLSVADGKTLTLNAGLTGSEVLVKTGAGELKLTTAAQNTGGVQIDEGILSGTGASLSGSIANHGQIKFDQDVDGVFTGAVSGSGSIVKNGDGNLTLNGFVASGGIQLNGGSLTGDSLSLSSDIAMVGGTSVIFKEAAGLYNGILSGSGNLAVDGGVLHILSANTFDGSTFIRNDGTLIIDKAEALGSSALTISGGTLSAVEDLQLNGFTLGDGVNYISVSDGKTLTAGDLAGTSFVKTGEGDLLLNTANTHSGGTQITEGALIIEQEAALGSGIFAITGGTLKNNADLQISRNIYLDTATSAFNVKSATTITLGGILYGDGTLNKSGEGDLVLASANIFTGGINITQGSIIGDSQSIRGDINMSGGSSIIFDQNSNGYFDRNIITTAADTITKKGTGVLFMQGNNTIGTLQATAGLLVYNGNLTGNTQISQGADFMAAGNFNGDITVSGNFIAQDGEALAVTGALNVQSGATAQFGVTDGSVNTVTAGSLNIQSGAALDIYADGVFAAPQSFDILSASGISGVFDDVKIINNRRLLAAASYDGDILSVQITRLLSAFQTQGAQNSAQRAFAAAVDRASAAPSTDFEDFLNIVEDSSDRAALLNQSGGFIYANAFNATAFDSVVNNAYMRLYKQPDNRNSIQDNIWVETVNSYGRIDENDNSSLITNLANGVNIGLDNYYDGGFNFGGFASYSRHDLNHNKTETANGDEYMLGLYLNSQGVLWDFRGVFAMVYSDMNFERDLSFLSRSAHARGKAYGLNLDIEQGLNIGKIRPFIGLRGRYLNRQGINEQGADSINLKFNGDNVFAAYVRAGIGFTQYGKVDFYGDIALRQVLYEPDATLSIFGQDYTVEAADVKTVAEVNLGLQKRFSELLSIYGGAGLKIAAKTAAGNFNIGIRSYF